MKNILLLLLLTSSVVFGQMVTIPSGSFSMGSNSGDADESPLHEVSVSGFLMDKTEVTFAQYDSCVKAGKCSPAHYDDGKCVIWSAAGFRNVKVPVALRDPRYPVVCVSWFQADQYCKSKGKRLPSEAQWEYGARGGRDILYSWGNAAPSVANCPLPPKANCPAKAGSYAPNGYGLSDMTGNVWEWANDRYGRDYYSVSPEKDPAGPDVGQYRAIRGGGWYSSGSQLRLKNRHWFEPNFSEVSIGFRCVK